MKIVSATNARQRLSALIDEVRREPVMIRRQNGDAAVLIAPEDYERLCARNVEEFQRFCDRIAKRAAARGLTPDKLVELLTDEA
ncbi:MAG TPA: type II toxin-antitoxin system Phd/YefM family antitoxin [Candidatus Binataceae bacterium]|jgi:prevent-host-death family protein|nr:type II toxin-antitoxin system Phd/YefM family antitoxin [Candidatus Binataceae bacterium]